MSSQGPNPSDFSETYHPEFVGSDIVPAPRMAEELGRVSLLEQVRLLSEENSSLKLALAEKDQQIADGNQRIASLAARLEESYVHPVMGIPNRIWFEEFSKSIENPKPGREKPIDFATHTLVLGFLDVDGLKPVNDTLGHEPGNQLLHGIAQSVRGSIREINNDKIFQLGGDEIGVAIPIAKEKITDETTLKNILEIIKQRMTDDLDKNIRTSKMDPRVKALTAGVSIGFSVYIPGEPVKDALARADKAMYADKQARKAARQAKQDAASQIGGVVLSSQGDSVLE